MPKDWYEINLYESEIMSRQFMRYVKWKRTTKPHLILTIREKPGQRMMVLWILVCRAKLSISRNPASFFHAARTQFILSGNILI